MIAFEIKENRKRALLIHSVGPAVQDIFMTLKVPNATEERKEFDLALEALDGLFKPKRNVEYEIYQFRQAKQADSETLDAFHIKLKQLCQYCEFVNDTREIKSQIIQNCFSLMWNASN